MFLEAWQTTEEQDYQTYEQLQQRATNEILTKSVEINNLMPQ